jgi:hypothetical protein
MFCRYSAKQYDYHRLFPFQDHETLWKISGGRNLFDQQVVQVEEVVEGVKDHLQPQPRQGVLCHLEVISSGLYYKNILTIVSDDSKLRLCYKCFISPSLSLS